MGLETGVLRPMLEPEPVCASANEERRLPRHSSRRRSRRSRGARESRRGATFSTLRAERWSILVRVVPIGSNDGLLESATPECRGASQLLLYQRAQEAVIQRALPLARARLAARGFDVDLAVVKNSRDADGHVFGTQENYEVEIARGWRLLLYRSGLAVLLPVIALLLVLSVIAGVLAILVIAAMALVSPAARHYFRGFDQDSSPLSRGGDLRSDCPPGFLRVPRSSRWQWRRRSRSRSCCCCVSRHFMPSARAGWRSSLPARL